jgi:hypothetical protein
MNLLKYNDFLTESLIYDLIIESKLIYSSKFINILNKMKDNKVSKELIDLYSKDIEGINHNYIDISDQKDRVIFTQDRKVQELIGKEPQTWIVNDSQRYLTHSDKNDKIFSLLGYEKPDRDPWTPNVGTKGFILNEIVSPTSGKIFVIFQEIDVDNPKKTVLNKQGISISDDYNKIWSHARNPVNIGKLARAILRSANVSFIDKDIEDFVNQYKATFDFLKDASNRFDVVKGSDIAHWYYHERYEDAGGTLNNSCMAEVDSDYFDIYAYNKQVSLVILYDDNGRLDASGKYTSDIIKGRALLWDCKLDGTKIQFMDRIYTSYDSDVELFKQFAEKNGWWYKTSQNSDPDAKLTDGNTSKYGNLICDLDQSDFEYYPYIDTLCFINTDDEIASNKPIGEGRECRDTGGEYETYYSDEDDDY